LKPQTAAAAPVDIVKRKSPIKKTVEFHPAPDIIPPLAAGGGNPSVASAMYASAATAAPTLPSKLPGQLSERHVSFV
jgi:hypothetical protein